MTEPIMRLVEVSAGYGPFRALFDVSIDVPAGAAVALLGSNGAGKSTVARVASGLIKPTAGRLEFDGADITGMPTWSLARRGIAHAPEGRSVFSSLTVTENLELAFRQALGRKGARDAMQRALDAFPQLDARRDQPAATLSGGEQRMLSLAKVLVRPPRLLIVDELSLGLAPIVVDEVFRTLREVRAQGTAILVVEQHVGRALALADEAVLLAKGRVTHRGPASELTGLADQMLTGPR